MEMPQPAIKEKPTQNDEKENKPSPDETEYKLPKIPDRNNRSSKEGVGNVLKKPGRSRFVPDTNATGAHSVFRRDPISGETTKYATYRFQTNHRNPNAWEVVKRFDKTGKFHHNNILGKDIYTPHIHDPLTPGGVRYPYTWEVP